MLGFSSESENDIKKISQQVHKYLKNKIETENIPIILYKPVPSPIDRIKNKFRWRIIIKCKFGEDIIDIINECNKEVFGKGNSSVNMSYNSSSGLDVFNVPCFFCVVNIFSIVSELLS